MLEYNKVKEIKNLIRKGFDLELLSFELDIPIEEIRKYKLELKNVGKDDSVRSYSAKGTENDKNKYGYLEMK